MASTAKYHDRILAAGVAMDLHVTDAQAGTLEQYISHLQRWNRTYNLTALRQPEQMLIQHIFDSLSAVGPVEERLYKNTVSESRIMDVGSGAGLPGIILAIMKPHWHVTCVDAVEKKMAFVRQMAGALRLPNLQAVHGRIEALEPAGADIVISRAFASLEDFASLAGRHVGANGWLVSMKGVQPEEEIAALAQHTDWRVAEVAPLQVPELDAQRCLVWMSRQGTV